MENVTITKKEYDVLKEKSQKWDDLGSEIEKFYSNKDGEYDEENPECEGDICTIGEIAAMAYGWM